MKVEMPTLIEDFVKALNDKNAEAYSSCFTLNATVDDDGEKIEGREAISEWFSRTMKNYSYTTEPLEFKKNGNQIFMKAKASGSFPGSPLNFDYHIDLKSDLIQNLRVEVSK